MEKLKRFIKIFATVIACIVIVIIIYSVIAMPNIATRKWILSYAQQADVPQFVIAHNKDMDLSNDKSGLYNFSNPIELICEAKNGKLVLTDKTNGKIYEGTYKITSLGAGKFDTFKGQHYTIVIDGMEGTANISSSRTMFMSIGGYWLNFEVD